MRHATTVVVALATTAAFTLLGGCSDQKESYCGAVESHQEELSSIVGDGSQDSLLRALDIFRDLQDRAPRDITDEWQQVVSRIETLDEALRDAGVDPATYDRATEAAGLTDAQRARIDAAARELGSGTTLAALAALDQQARDVCQTPLTL